MFTRRLTLLLLLSLLALLSWPLSTLAATEAPAARLAPFQGHAACAGISATVLSTPECDALMAARPAPPFGQVPVDLGIVDGLGFMTFTQPEVAIYDAPGGNQVDTLVTGYSYFVPLRYEGNYALIRGNRWVSLDEVAFSRPSSYSGLLLDGPQDMPFAWVLWGHNASAGPGGRSDPNAGRVERFQRVYIYATVSLGWDWHLVGPGQWVNQKNLSIVYPTPPTQQAGRWAAVNLYEQNLVAYDGSTPVMAALVSSGVKNGAWDTNEGTFTIHNRVEAGKMSGSEGQADAYWLDMVPYAQYFDQLISLHGTYGHNMFGCIRRATAVSTSR
ncbi:MAG: L,D-transpeptidase [Anaerolineae bacterium]|nr:L,D-transpeptidase [Anaerolineae bacterium]